jgi:hypothetical protein
LCLIGSGKTGMDGPDMKYGEASQPCIAVDVAGISKPGTRTARESMKEKQGW